MLYGRSLKQKRSILRQLNNRKKLLIQLQAIDPCFSQFESWNELIIALPRQKLRSPPIDKMLRIIINQSQLKPDEKWNLVLTAIFSPLLEVIFNKLTNKFDLPHDKIDDLWQNIHWSFLKVLNRIDLVARKGPVASKIYNDVYHDLYLHIVADSNLTTSEVDIDVFEYIDISSLDLVSKSDEIEIADCRCDLDRFRSDGLIDDLEYHLLYGRIIYGEPLIEAAERLGVGNEIAKKRHQRAVKKIQDSRKKMSPKRRKYPL